MKTVRGRIEPDSGPAAREPGLEPREISWPGAKKLPRRVLVVDDEPLIRWSVTETLADLGLDVEQADCAAAALQAITRLPLAFDLIVLDLRLPDMRDLALLATIRQLLPQAAVVLMTAFTTPDLLAEARRLGVRGVLHKPFELDELTHLVTGGGVGHT